MLTEVHHRSNNVNILIYIYIQGVCICHWLLGSGQVNTLFRDCIETPVSRVVAFGRSDDPQMTANGKRKNGEEKPKWLMRLRLNTWEEERNEVSKMEKMRKPMWLTTSEKDDTIPERDQI